MALKGYIKDKRYWFNDIAEQVNKKLLNTRIVERLITYYYRLTFIDILS